MWSLTLGSVLGYLIASDVQVELKSIWAHKIDRKAQTDLKKNSTPKKEKYLQIYEEFFSKFQLG